MTDAVLFDLDDTLIDHTAAAASAVVAWADAHGVAGEPAEHRARWVAVSSKHYSRYQRRELTFVEQGRERARDFLLLDLDDEQADTAFEGYFEKYRAAWTAFPDARRTLQRLLGAGIGVGILTNGDRAKQSDKVERVGLADLGLPLFASSDYPVGKPDPRPFLGACAGLGLRPEDVMMVGDSIPHDIEGARGAGLRAVLLDRYDAHPGHEGTTIRSLDDLDLAASAGGSSAGPVSGTGQ